MVRLKHHALIRSTAAVHASEAVPVEDVEPQTDRDLRAPPSSIEAKELPPLFHQSKDVVSRPAFLSRHPR
jgi:hypothetical protein